RPSIAAITARTAAGPPTPLRGRRPDVPAGIDRVLRRGLEHDPERRWQDLEALRVALLRFGPGQLAKGGLGLRLLAYGVDFPAWLGRCSARRPSWCSCTCRSRSSWRCLWTA